MKSIVGAQTRLRSVSGRVLSAAGFGALLVARVRSTLSPSSQLKSPVRDDSTWVNSPYPTLNASIQVRPLRDLEPLADPVAEEFGLTRKGAWIGSHFALHQYQCSLLWPDAITRLIEHASRIGGCLAVRRNRGCTCSCGPC